MQSVQLVTKKTSRQLRCGKNRLLLSPFKAGEGLAAPTFSNSILSPLILNTRETNAATVACIKQLASSEMEKLQNSWGMQDPFEQAAI